MQEFLEQLKRVLGWLSESPPVAGPDGFRWRRDPSLEVGIVPDWWREEESEC